MRKVAILLIVGFLVLLMVSCTAGPNKLAKSPDPQGETAGFLKGLWHGFITPVTFVISLFSEKINFYEVHNNGNWYNFGFVLGAGLFLSGGILGRGKSRKS